MSPVNSKQAEKARQTRKRVLTAAGELFVEHGYGATTLQQIAERADVAVQTIYFVFRNKRTLLKELADVTVAGDDEPVPTMERPWFTAAMAAPTAEEHLRAHVAGAVSVNARVSALLEVIRTAAALEPELDALRRTGDEQRYTVQHTAAQALMAKPGARPGLTAEHAADLLYATLGPEMYLLLVRDRGWSAGRFADWADASLRSQLLQ
ncbi:transcriptional regulator, TetR family [Catenulispora acidiphila DSM 44928]|uniref:Transcriptional regulator, TetR family n=1 Tax=Catenulispora acidiphila (strain DSM 44928 / JCM 14897 / NBRC 102108 / NRRL B-24433 / ID139908) TaxID=479433 RepID=C7Q0E4_CATAD|nr:TetR/AcrR family transcriptional regulator [Catenulispora acidiphila]ACU77477.1 transcriptional regulator, TetR family [Catenulispora acidiphila DSM 44928]